MEAVKARSESGMIQSGWPLTPIRPGSSGIPGCGAFDILQQKAAERVCMWQQQHGFCTVNAAAEAELAGSASSAMTSARMMQMRFTRESYGANIGASKLLHWITVSEAGG